MSWAGKRQFLIIGGIVLALLVILGVAAFLIFHSAPSCMDSKQNRDEQGIDCGGTMCTYLCATALADPNPPRFTRALLAAPNRTDVIAYIDNPNTAIAKGAAYTLTLYDTNASVITTKKGTVDLEPSGVVTPVFVPSAYLGPIPVVRAHLSLDSEHIRWYPGTPPMLTARNIALATAELPRVTASIHNPTATLFRNVKAVATVFDLSGNAMAASQTVLQELPAQGDALVTFTWNYPFPEPAGRIEVVPVASLPAPK